MTKDQQQQQQQETPPTITIYNGEDEDSASGRSKVLTFDVITPHVPEERMSCQLPAEEFHSKQEDINSIESLLQAIHEVTKLACMDTADYEASLSSNSQLLQQPLQHGALPPAALAPLIQAIHRLHANVAVARAEQDDQAAEILALHQQVYALQLQERKLQKAVSKLIKQNDSTQVALEQARSEKAQLQQQLKKVIHRVKESEYQHKELLEWNTAYKLQAHEMVLSSSGNNRVRLASTDSNFSDLEALDFYKCTSANTTATTTYEGESVSSVSSHCSFVTEEGIATVRFTEPPITTEQQQEEVESYTIEYPVGSKLGIHVLALALPRERGVLTEAMLSMKEDEPKQFRWGSLLGKSNQTTQRNGFFVSEVVEKLEGVPPPKVGARIVSINNVPVEPTWTLARVLDALHGKGSCEDIVRVLYRHDVLTDDQQEVLFKDSDGKEDTAVAETCTPSVKEESVHVTEKNEKDMDPSYFNIPSTDAAMDEDTASDRHQHSFTFVPFWQKNDAVPVEADSQPSQAVPEKLPDKTQNLHALERLTFWNKKDGKKESLAQPPSDLPQPVETTICQGCQVSGSNIDYDADFQSLESSDRAQQQSEDIDARAKQTPQNDKRMHERLQNAHANALDRLTFWNKKDGRTEATVTNQSKEQSETSSSDVENEGQPLRTPTPGPESHPSNAKKVGPSFGTTMAFTNPFKMQ